MVFNVEDYNQIYSVLHPYNGVATQDTITNTGQLNDSFSVNTLSMLSGSAAVIGNITSLFHHLKKPKGQHIIYEYISSEV